jgi:hypothetical protein
MRDKLNSETLGRLVKEDIGDRRTVLVRHVVECYCD